MDLNKQLQGQWYGVLSAFIDPGFLRDRHGPCPGCGGTDRFRWDDRDGKGTFYCGGGGEPVSGDGFALLNHVCGWDFKHAANEVERVMGVDKRNQKIPTSYLKPAPKPAKTADYAKRLWEAANLDDSYVAAHPYALAKGIPHACGAGRGRATGKVIGQGADCLIIPMRTIKGVLTGVECIGAPGEKTPKQTFGKKGLLILGNTLDKTLSVYITEGWADAVSVWKAFGNVVVIAVFGNYQRQKQLSAALNNHNPNRDYIVVRDA